MPDAETNADLRQVMEDLNFSDVSPSFAGAYTPWPRFQPMLYDGMYRSDPHVTARTAPSVHLHPPYPLDMSVARQYTFILELGYMNRVIPMSQKLRCKQQRKDAKEREFMLPHTGGWMDSETGKMMNW